jgi:hypothetical protein
MATREQYRNRRNICCWIGPIAAFIGNVMIMSGNGAGFLPWSGGIILNFVGAYNWTRYKGRSGWYTLWAILAPIGFIGLAALQDRWGLTPENSVRTTGWQGD